MPSRTFNTSLSTDEREVILIEAIGCTAGDVFNLVFESQEPRWRQGVWLGTNGVLRINEVSAAGMVVWADKASSAEIEIECANDGLLRFYNIWDSGRGQNFESQRLTSGMLTESTANGGRYRCSDINPDPTFEALVFRLERA